MVDPVKRDLLFHHQLRGNIMIPDITAQTVSLGCSSGDVKVSAVSTDVSGLTGAIDIATISGDINIGELTGELDIGSSSGDITVKLPSECPPKSY